MLKYYMYDLIILTTDFKQYYSNFVCAMVKGR